MSNLFGIFIVLYGLFLIIHGSIYSSTLQSISDLKQRSKSKGVNKKAVQAEINKKFRKLTRMIRVTWLAYAILFATHLFFISLQENPEDDVHINAVYLFTGACVTLFVMNWLKSNSKSDKNPSFKG